MADRVGRMFDFQRFQQNPKLKNVIQDVESRYGHALDDDDLELVNAAGEVCFAQDTASNGSEPEPDDDFYPVGIMDECSSCPPE